jgi:hypothetical protein
VRTALRESPVTSRLDQLEALGDVERVSNPPEQRAILIARTDKDRAIGAEYWRVSTEMICIVYAGFSPAEVDAFERCPTRVLEDLSQAEGVPLGKKGHAHVAAATERGTTIQDFAPRGDARLEDREDLRQLEETSRRAYTHDPSVASDRRCLVRRIPWVYRQDFESSRRWPTSPSH